MKSMCNFHFIYHLANILLLVVKADQNEKRER
jgi:hypothetical protein